MAYTLDNTIRNMYLFGGESSHHVTRRGDCRNSTYKYLEIPINKEVFEVPLIAMQSFEEQALVQSPVDAIVVKLDTEGFMSGYKSFNRQILDILRFKLYDTRLISIKTTYESQPVYYYGAVGSIFDHNLTPLMMCTWEIKRYQLALEEDGYKYEIIRPIMRFHPRCIINPENEIEKFIATKLSKAVLSRTYENPFICNLGSRLVVGNRQYRTGKIEIDKIPFIVKGTEAPTINTTNADLINIALNHLEELIA